MKLKHYLLSPVAVIIVMTMITGFAFYALYSETKKSCLNELEQLFVSAIYQEKEKRIDREHLFFSYNKSNTSSHQIVIQQENKTTVMEKPDAIKEMTFHEKQNQADHSYLFFKKRFVNIDTLDSIIQVELRKHNISAQTAIAYTDHINHTVCHSCDDSSIYKSAWRTPPMMLGIRNETTLQCFARPMVLSMIRKDSKSFAIVFIAWAIATGTVLFFTFLNKKRVAESARLTKNKFRITEDILLDTDKLLIVYHGSEIKLTTQLFKLLESLWAQPDHYACYQDLAYMLFGSKDIVKVENRLAKSINRLRKELQDVPELEVENIPHKGYRVMLKNEIEPLASNL